MLLYRRTLGVAVLAAACLLAQPVAARAQGTGDCGCPSADEQVSRGAAGAIGGGLFAGLLAAFLVPHHAAGHPSVVGMPVGTLAPDPRAPDVSFVGSAAGAADTASSPSHPGAHGLAAKPRLAAAPMAAMTPDDARREGLVPPKTATLLPALAMIGAGLLLLGLFLLRQRSPYGSWR